MESLEESMTRKPSRVEEILLLERKKRALLHEMKVLAQQIKAWTKAGHISPVGDKDKKDAATLVIIPESDDRVMLTQDTLMQKKILKTFERFSYVREILSNSVMVELKVLQAQKGANEGNNS